MAVEVVDFFGLIGSVEIIPKRLIDYNKSS